jgi:hypothetical protein
MELTAQYVIFIPYRLINCGCLIDANHPTPKLMQPTDGLEDISAKLRVTGRQGEFQSAE